MVNSSRAVLIGKLIHFIGFFSPLLAAKIIGYFFSRPKKVMPSPQQEQCLIKAQKLTVQLNGDVIQVYRWQGNGPKIWFAHGWKSNSGRWNPFIDILTKRGYDIYALDAPRHGHSTSKIFSPFLYAQWIDCCIRKYGGDILVGHSAGGYASMYGYHKYRFPVKYIVVMAPTFDMRQPITTMFEMLNLSQRIRLAFIRYFETSLGETLDDIVATHLVKDFDIDGLIIHDTTDNVIPVDGSHHIHKAWSKSELSITTGYGHRLQHKIPIQSIVTHIMQHNK
ncbi:MAG: alpha/beta hydrolase [Lewinellaceae bacterium]|nr:alpha/beta hydrolase [Lewinellaceae bacterium]